MRCLGFRKKSTNDNSNVISKQLQSDFTESANSKPTPIIMVQEAIIYHGGVHGLELMMEDPYGHKKHAAHVTGALFCEKNTNYARLWRAFNILPLKKQTEI
jgi:hypothetical protein